MLSRLNTRPTKFWNSISYSRNSYILNQYFVVFYSMRFRKNMIIPDDTILRGEESFRILSRVSHVTKTWRWKLFQTNIAWFKGNRTTFPLNFHFNANTLKILKLPSILSNLNYVRLENIISKHNFEKISQHPYFPLYVHEFNLTRISSSASQLETSR